MLTTKMKPLLITFFAVLAAGSLIISMAFRQPEKQQQQYEFKFVSDTVPDKKNSDREARDLDKAMQELQRGIEKLNVDLQIDMEKLQEELARSLKEIDTDKIKLEVEKGLAEAKEAIAKIDFDKIKIELDNELSKINTEEIRINMDKLKAELKEMKPKLEKELQKAKVEMEKAKKELQGTKEFIQQLDNDGLIDKTKDYKIQHKNGGLIINGEKQPAKIYDKYKKFLDEHKNFNLKKEGDDFNFGKDNNTISF